MSLRKKNQKKPLDKKQSIEDVLKKKPEFSEVKLLSDAGVSKIVAFKINGANGVNIILESHTKDQLTLQRLINSFNPEGMDIKKDYESLIKTANKFNRGSIGIKATIIQRESENIITFTTEEIIPSTSERTINANSVYVKSSILSGAPVIFEKLSEDNN